MQLEILRSLS